MPAEKQLAGGVKRPGGAHEETPSGRDGGIVRDECFKVNGFFAIQLALRAGTNIKDSKGEALS
jgi:hypothetical protein